MKSLKDYSLSISEKEYHELPFWSHSTIARYARDGFSSIATLHTPAKSTPAMEFGSLFDSILTKGRATLKEYAVMNVSVPDAEKKALDYISTRTDKRFEELDMNEVNDFCNECQYQAKWKAQTRYEHLAPYAEYLDIKQSGKKIVSEEDWSDAMDMARVFRNDPYLCDLFGTKNTDETEYIYQAKFTTDMDLGFGETVTVKIMPDLLKVNHKDKTVQPVDLKTSSMPAYEFSENFVKLRYDIQASVYTDVLQKVMNNDEDYRGYTILPYLFTDISRTDKVPVTYEYDPRSESQIDGLSFQSRRDGHTIKYKGWRRLLEEIISYEKEEAKVPSNIKTSEPNNLLSILSNES